MSEEVEFIRGNDRINHLAQRPDIAAEFTQAELARRMGTTQAAISRIEQPHDLLLSTSTPMLAEARAPKAADPPPVAATPARWPKPAAVTVSTHALWNTSDVSCRIFACQA